MLKKRYFARNEQGKLVPEYFDNPEAARRWQEDMKRRRDAYKDGKPLPVLETITVGEASRLYLQSLVGNRPISTINDYAGKLRNHVLRFSKIKDSRLSEFSQEMIELLLNHVQDAHGLDNATRNRVRSVLQSLFNWAITKKIVKANPVNLIEVKKENPRKVYVRWSKEQCETYLAGARERNWEFYIYTQLLLNVGGRKNELNAIQWRHVDFERRVIKIEQIYEQATSQIVQRTKSDGLKKELRVKYAGMSPALLAALREHKEKTRYGMPDDFVVTVEYGAEGVPGPLKPRLATTWHTRLVVELELPHCRIHDLRHVLASLLYKTTRDLKAVQDQLGHSDIKTTQRYVHTDEDDAAERMNRFNLFSHEADQLGQSGDTKSDTIEKLTQYRGGLLQ